MLKIGIQFFGGRGSGSGMDRSGASANTFKSQYGLPNVGTRESFVSIGGRASHGTVVPTVDDVQAYFDTGAFDNFGTSNSAKKTMAERIARDMNGRGFEMQIADDGIHLLPDGDTGKTITLGRSNGKWVAKTSASSGTRERGGMRGALDRASRPRPSTGQNTKFTSSQINSMSRSQLETVATAIFVRQNTSRGLSTEEATRRAGLLMDGNTSAQLRKYIRKNG